MVMIDGCNFAWLLVMRTLPFIALGNSVSKVVFVAIMKRLDNMSLENGSLLIQASLKLQRNLSHASISLS